MGRKITGFICNKDGCSVNKEMQPELEQMMKDWDKKIRERTEMRKSIGCWNPESVVCDCPACGGFND